MWRDGLMGPEGEGQGGEMPVEKPQAPWKQGDTAESNLVGGTITITSLSPFASMGS